MYKTKKKTHKNSTLNGILIKLNKYSMDIFRRDGGSKLKQYKLLKTLCIINKNKEIYYIYYIFGIFFYTCFFIRNFFKIDYE